jgi:hypothetical protein
MCGIFQKIRYGQVGFSSESDSAKMEIGFCENTGEPGTLELYAFTSRSGPT